MGGCRCCFRDCEVSTITGPGTHFFHFPVKDKERLEKWITYSQNPHFRELSMDKVKNKVICQNHFRMKHFMNYKKERVTKFAVPTLYTRGSEIIDVETDKAVVNESRANADPPISLNKMIGNKRRNSNITLDIHVDKIPKIEDDDVIQIPDIIIPQKVKPVKILNKSVVSDKVPCYPVYKVLNNNNNTMTNLVQKSMPSKTSFEVINVVDIQKNKKSAVTIQQLSEEDDKVYFEDSSQEEVETAVASSTSELERSTPTRKAIAKSQGLVPIANPPSNLAFIHKAFMEQKAQVEYLRTAVIERINDLGNKLEQQDSSQSSSSSEKSSLTKVQLFNGIKRYLNPAMIALLRMEMFATAEREYKLDEKEFAIELADLGDNVYKYMRDEWRFRLPSKKCVDEWKNTIADDQNEDL